MPNLPELLELEDINRQAAGLIARLKDKYAVEHQRLIQIPDFGWVVVGPGSHIRKATPAEIAASEPKGAV